MNENEKDFMEHLTGLDDETVEEIAEKYHALDLYVRSIPFPTMRATPLQSDISQQLCRFPQPYALRNSLTHGHCYAGHPRKHNQPSL